MNSKEPKSSNLNFKTPYFSETHIFKLHFRASACCELFLVLVIVRIGRTLGFRNRVFGQVVCDDSYRLLQLWIFPLPNDGWIELHLYIRENTDILSDPMAVGAPIF